MACPVKLLILFVVNCLAALLGGGAAQDVDKQGNVVVLPDDKFPYLVMVDEEESLMFKINNSRPNPVNMKIQSTHPDIAEIRNHSYYIEEIGPSNLSVKVRGVFLGRTNLKMSFSEASPDLYEHGTNTSDPKNGENNFEWYEMPDQFEVAVGRKASAMSHSFTGMIIILVCLANVAMGCKTELPVLKETLKKPIAPLTGMFSQFVLMPLISLAVVYILKFDPVNALGFFAMGCSPGGSASNMYSYLLAGDVSLSVTMTFCSTVVALGMIPLWLFTIGTRVLYRTDVQIPYQNIMYSLVGLLVPVVIGMILKKKLPKVAKVIVMGIRPLMVIFFILVFTIGVYANLYIFDLMRNKPEILLAGALVPYIGFLFGGGVAIIMKQSWKRIRTIAIETGIQNTGIAIVLLKVSLPPPDNDISIVAPIAAAIFTPIPMLVAILGHEIYVRCYKPKKEVEVLEDGQSSENRSVDMECKYKNVMEIGSDDESHGDEKMNNNSIHL